MTDEERQAVREHLTFAARELRSAQRTIEMLANLLEYIRREVLLPLGPNYNEVAYRVFNALVQTPNLERRPLYAPHWDKSDKTLPQPEWKQRGWESEFRWVVMDHALPQVMRFGDHYEQERFKLLMDELQKETVR